MRVKVQRKSLFHILEHEEQKEVMKRDDGNSRNYYGKVLSGNGNQGYRIQFDELPVGMQIVHIKRRERITVVEDGEEEKMYDRELEECEECTSSPSKTRKDNNPMMTCQRDFKKLDDDIFCHARNLT